jgi:hypothetical protein
MIARLPQLHPCIVGLWTEMMRLTLQAMLPCSQSTRPCMSCLTPVLLPLSKWLMFAPAQQHLLEKTIQEKLIAGTNKAVDRC